MVKFLTSFLFIACLCMYETTPAQTENDTSAHNRLEWSNPDNLPAPPIDAQGYPSRSAGLDVLPGFQNPPPGYGEVPFWWWSGDPLDKDRLLWQIEELHKKGISGMQVNYIHKDTPGFPTWPVQPEIFRDQWWDMWKFAADECRKRGMGIGLSGYTLDWPKSDNLFKRIIYSILEIQGQELIADTTVRVAAGKSVAFKIPKDAVGVWAYPIKEGKLKSAGKDLQSWIQNSTLNWTPEKGEWEVWLFSAQRKQGTINPMHPLSGKTVIEKFFQPFQDHAVDNSSSGLDYFFQDELQFGVGDRIWTSDFNEVFTKQKGYAVFELLPALFTDMGPATAKARLDFMDVKVQLTEERYLKPIFDWHWSRGKIYGCDPEGRGKEPGNYGDNFRAIRWYTAPGHDTPGGHADLIKGKVSSSIANLYKRPRVWLEGYHSLGWGATPERLMFATCENYLYGCNLLNLHGLYYSTHGSFWEWAPPCYHFRMPYWDHMGVFLKYFERLSYLLSQGVLQADVAILYPVSPVQADLGGKEAVEIAFNAGTGLFNNGHDFIFMDDQSLLRAKVRDGQLQVSDGSYRILVLPAMKALHWATMQKALEFYRNGGIVFAVGALPEASDRIPEHDPQLFAAVQELFGATEPGKKPAKLTSKAGGIGQFVENADQLKNEIAALVDCDVHSDQSIKAMHRKIGPRDVYMIMGAAKGSYCTFRSKGRVEQWDPWTGKNVPIYEANETEGGTRVKMPLSALEAQIIVFSPQEKQAEILSSQLDEISRIDIKEGRTTLTGYAETPGRKSATLRVNGQIRTLSGIALVSPAPVTLAGDWEFELKPTMDNRWGDFRLPVTESMIGPEARIFSYATETSDPTGWELPNTDDSKWPRVTHGFGQKFWKLGPLPKEVDIALLDKQLLTYIQPDPSVPVLINGEFFNWTPYNFSWRMGLEGDPGHQGYHGLKEYISDDFICLGKPAAGLNETLYKEEAGGTCYYLQTSAFADRKTSANIFMAGLEPAAIFLNSKQVAKSARSVKLNKGANSLLLRYNSPGRGHFVLQQAGAGQSTQRTPLSMKWWDMADRIPFDVFPEEPSPAGWYRFTAPPGLAGMTIIAWGTIQVWLGEKPQKVSRINESAPAKFKILVEKPNAEKVNVAIRIEQVRGVYGGSALPEPIQLDCRSGIMPLGDWSQGSVLECYSGGAWYRKTIILSKRQAQARTMLNLGQIVATAEVRINGKTAGILVSPPWQLDVSACVQEGENRIEILVYNTLANHYVTIPTRYRGDSLKSGLIGPVTMEFTQRVVLSE